YAFNVFDTNNDGTIDFQEFLLAVASRSLDNIDAHLDFIFDMYDFSHDELIDQRELSGVITAMYDLLGTSNRKGDRDPKILAAHIMTYLDVNGDNKVNRAEFIAGCKNNDSIRQLLAPNI
ncbi:unnamed protein product, partial [Rotaria sp. Silwood1]